jgi:hypothetical protein
LDPWAKGYFCDLLECDVVEVDPDSSCGPGLQVWDPGVVFEHFAFVVEAPERYLKTACQPGKTVLKPVFSYLAQCTLRLGVIYFTSRLVHVSCAQVDQRGSDLWTAGSELHDLGRVESDAIR